MEFFFQRVKVPYLPAVKDFGRRVRLTPEALASRKVVWGDPDTEGSGTAKSGTDEQNRAKRAHEHL